jgi:CheY-like chemotaxis protein
MKEILVVDDDCETLDAIVELLWHSGYQAVGAASGPEALTRANTTRPDLFLIDLFMPVMDGLELIARLGEDPDLARRPKVAMTAWPRPLELPHGVSLLKKPFELEALLKLISLHGAGPIVVHHKPLVAEPSAARLVAALT